MSEMDLWALSQDALVLLDTFADCLERGRYRRQDIETFATKLLDSSGPSPRAEGLDMHHPYVSIA